MKRLHTSLLLLVVVGLPCGLAAQRDQDTPAPGLIPRFRQVADGFYRGGQPRKEGFAYLKRIGVKTIVNLRGENDERAQVEKLGFKYVHIPMSPRERVPEHKIESFFQVLRDRRNYPVFVHCERGADRVGFMVALYRIAFQGWDAAKAYEEARSLGMRWWYRGLKQQLYDFATRQSTHAPAALPR